MTACLIEYRESAKGARMTIVAIGDVGVLDDMVHIGDEAMFEHFVHAMHDRRVEVIGLSANPAETAARYGIDAISRIGFTGSRAEMTERMRRVLAADLPPDDPAHAVIAAVRASTGVVIAGGGNMASTWPLHIYERATLGLLAHAAGVPLVVTGQTIGPALIDADAELVAGLLSSAALVGLREGASLALCESLGVPANLLHRLPDDASFLRADGDVPSSPYALVTLAAHLADHDREAVVSAIATLLDDVVSTTGLEIVFSPHFGSLDGRERGDSVMHTAVRGRMRAGTREISAASAAASAALARGAGLVVTSRYHPAVFAVSEGVPTIGISVDDYTAIKLEGALGTFGQHSVLSAGSLDDGSRMLRSVWDDRLGIRARGLALAAEQRQLADAWFDEIARVVS
jgi:polysaccharide pyruvyl transferase WcaK-like protein